MTKSYGKITWNNLFTAFSPWTLERSNTTYQNLQCLELLLYLAKSPCRMWRWIFQNRCISETKGWHFFFAIKIPYPKYAPWYLMVVLATHVFFSYLTFNATYMVCLSLMQLIGDTAYGWTERFLAKDSKLVINHYNRSKRYLRIEEI